MEKIKMLVFGITIVDIVVLVMSILTLISIYKYNESALNYIPQQEHSRFAIIAFAEIIIVAIACAIFIRVGISSAHFTNIQSTPDFITGWAVLGNLFKGGILALAFIAAIVFSFVILTDLFGITLIIFINKHIRARNRINTVYSAFMWVYTVYLVLINAFIFCALISK